MQGEDVLRPMNEGPVRDGAMRDDYRETQEGKHENKIREIRIQQLNKGYVVNVGCQAFAFSTQEEMLGKVVDYIKNPAAVEKHYQLNNTI